MKNALNRIQISLFIGLAIFTSFSYGERTRFFSQTWEPGDEHYHVWEQHTGAAIAGQYFNLGYAFSGHWTMALGGASKRWSNEINLASAGMYFDIEGEESGNTRTDWCRGYIYYRDSPKFITWSWDHDTQTNRTLYTQLLDAETWTYRQNLTSIYPFIVGDDVISGTEEWVRADFLATVEIDEEVNTLFYRALAKNETYNYRASIEVDDMVVDCHYPNVPPEL